MPETLIPAHVDGATVEIFEPRQRPGQEEVVLDRFELLPGESRNYEIRSATAGMRYLPLGDETRRQIAERDPAPEAVHENPYGIMPHEEMGAGKERLQEVQAMEEKQAKSAKQGKKETREPTDKRSKEELKAGGAAREQFAEGVTERGEAARGSNEPHAGTPDVDGQTRNSPLAHVSDTSGPERTAANAPRVVSEPDQAKAQLDTKRKTAEERDPKADHKAANTSKDTKKK